MTDEMQAIEMIRESAVGLADRRDLGRIRALRYRMPGFDRETWTAMCEMGWPALRVSEEDGGVGLGMAAAVALSEELGAALAPEPLGGAMLAARLLTGHPQRDLLSGARLILPAWQEGRRDPLVGGTTRLENGRVTGTKRFVAMAAGADAFLILTPTGAALIDYTADGLVVETTATQDGGHHGTLHLSGAAADPVQLACDVNVALAEATLANAGYLLGIVDAAMVRTLDYLRTRVQFGKPIGSFQALQHRAVDLTLEQALMRASIEDAARRWDANPGSHEASTAVSRAKARAAQTAMLVTRQAIQLHGGIGYTDEHDIGLFLRKAMVICPAYGDAAYHRARFADRLTAHVEPAQ